MTTLIPCKTNRVYKLALTLCSSETYLQIQNFSYAASQSLKEM